MGHQSQIVVLFESCDEFEGEAVPAASKGWTRMRISKSGMILTPRMNEDGTMSSFVQIIGNVDPMLVSIPSCAINVIVKNLAHMLVKMMRKEVAKVNGSVYEERIRTKTEFYGYLKRRLRELGFEEANTLDGSTESF